MLALVSSVFVAALLGSVHCAAMCGSFACLASGATVGLGPTPWRPAAAYHLGRLASYLALGALAGAAGAGLDRAGGLVGDIAGLARPAAVVAGVLLLLWGGASLASALGLRVPMLAVPPRLTQWLATAVRALPAERPVRRAAALGALTAALPCGWLYAFVATAAAAGGLQRGALTMLVFWMGTVPMLVTVGMGARWAFGPLRRHLPALTAVIVMFLGGLTIAGRLAPPRVVTATPVSHGHHAHP